VNVLNENEVGPSRASAVVLFRRVGSDVCEARGRLGSGQRAGESRLLATLDW